MKEYLLDLNDKVINGETNPLEAYIELKRVEVLLKRVMLGCKEGAIDEALKYGKGEHEQFGAKFQVKNGAGRWSYKANEEWVRMSADMKGLEERLKGIAQSGLKAIDDNGEIIAGAEFSEGSTTISIKL